MPLTECAAPGVLAAQTHARTFERERSKGNRFSEGPIYGHTSLAHFRAPRELAHHLWIQMKAVRNNGNLLRDLRDDSGGYRRFDNVRAIDLRNFRFGRE